MDIPNYSVTSSNWREAFEVENKIVCFGLNSAKTTEVIEQGEDSEKLQIIRKDLGFDLLKGDYNTASCVLKNEIYAFKREKYGEVHRYNLQSGKWSLFYSNK